MISPDRPGLAPHGVQSSPEGAGSWGQKSELRSHPGSHRTAGTCPPIAPRRRRPRGMRIGEGLYAGEPETCRRQLLPFLRIDGTARAAAGGLQGIPDRGPGLPGAGHPDGLAPCPSTTWPPTAGRSPCSWRSRSAGLFWVFGTEVAAIVAGPRGRPDRRSASCRSPGPPAPPAWPRSARAWPCSAAESWLTAIPVDRLARPGDDVHVPHDDLPV